jgi:hypothetical protein
MWADSLSPKIEKSRPRSILLLRMTPIVYPGAQWWTVLGDWSFSLNLQTLKDTWKYSSIPQQKIDHQPNSICVCLSKRQLFLLQFQSTFFNFNFFMSMQAMWTHSHSLELENLTPIYNFLSLAPKLFPGSRVVDSNSALEHFFGSSKVCQ